MRSNPLAADTLATYQFASVFRKSPELPEKRLFVAVLTSAIAEFYDAIGTPARRKDWPFHELLAWFFSRDRSWPFSFENLCDYLDLSPDCIRQEISSVLHQKHLPQPEVGKGS